MKVTGQPIGRWVLVILVLIGTSLICTEPTRRHAAFNGPVDTNTIVRFFYQPPLSHPRPPRILRAVDDRDPRLDTAPFQVEGRAVCISLAEMRKVVQILSDSIPSWDTSKDVEGPRPAMGLPFPNGLEITVYFSTGTARTVITPGELCATLAPLDVALRNRALWEFQFFRGDYGCNVPGFDLNKYYKEHFSGDR
jgi:hypothetical protein